MTVLVTGGAGFIGSHFIDRLLASDADARIVCLDDFNDFYNPALKRANVERFVDDPRVTLVEASICDAAAVGPLLAQHAVRQIMHLGGYAGVRSSADMPLKYQQANVGGTLTLLEAARQHPLDRFVFVSSSTVYGADCEIPFREDAPLGLPLSVYGVTKRAAELLAQHYHQTCGVPVVSVRPFSVYGPRIRPDLALWAFTDAIHTGRPLALFGDGSIQRDFTHVSDICAGLLAALCSDDCLGQTINLGHHQPVAIGELVRLIEEQLGRKAQIDRRAAFAGDMPVTCADLQKAERLLGYRPRVSLPEGVREFVAWYLGQQ